MNSMLPVGDTISQSFIKSIKAKNHEKKRLKESNYVPSRCPLDKTIRQVL